jgi:hypothetical protein
MNYQRNHGAVRGFAMAMKFANWLNALPTRLTPPAFRLMQIGSAFWQSRALYVAARLDIAGTLGDELMPVETLAAKVEANADALVRLLRMLTALGIFSECRPRSYRNNELSNHLRDDRPNSVRAMILMHGSAEMSRPWFEQLETGVRRGETPFRLTHGEELYAYLDGHGAFNSLFSAAMDSVESLAGDAFASDFAWERFARVIDLGGARGSKSLAILRRHPQLTALVVDRPATIGEARCYWENHPAVGCERLELLNGDLLQAVPPGRTGDIYLLSAVLHGYDDDGAAAILARVAAGAASHDTPLAILELVLPEMGADLASASFDMQMFMGTRGRERTLSEWRSLLARGGWALAEVVGLQSFGNILLARPQPAG